MSAAGAGGAGATGASGAAGPSRITGADRLAAAALLVVVVRHAFVTSSIVGPALVGAALLGSMVVPARLPLGLFAQRTGTALAGAAGGTIAFLEAPEVRTLGLSPGWATISMIALFAATFRLWVRERQGGFLATFIAGLVALVACGETIFGGGYAVFVVGYLLVGLVALRAHDAGRAPLAVLPRRAWIATGVLVALAAGASVAIAIALPPLALRLRDRLISSFGPATTGLGDRMVLGSLEGMLVSDEVVARVYGPPTDYLRGVVYDHYQAGQWAASTTEGTRTVRGAGNAAHDGGGAPATEDGRERVRVVLVSSKRGDRYPVPLGARAIATPDGDLVVDRFGALRPEHGGPTEISFEIAEGAESADYPPVRPAPFDKRTPVKLADSVSPLVRSWADETQTAEERVNAIADHLRTEYRYSLEYERKGGDPLLSFLQDDRQGHCEYFASAMAILARRAGVSARVVAGYRVAERNELGGYGVVRERNAHAWVEVFIPGKGWQTVDPTPPDLLPQNRAHATPFVSALFDVIGAWWGSARAWLAELSLLSVAAVLLGLIALGLVVRWWQQRARRDVAASLPFFQAEAPPPALERLLSALARAGHRRDAAEPLERFAERLSSGAEDGSSSGTRQDVSNPEPQDVTGRARRALLRYAALRYGGIGDAEELFAEMDRCSAAVTAAPAVREG